MTSCAPCSVATALIWTLMLRNIGYVFLCYTIMHRPQREHCKYYTSANYSVGCSNALTCAIDCDH